MKQTCCFLGISFNDYFLRGGLGSQIKEMLNILGYITSKKIFEEVFKRI